MGGGMWTHSHRTSAIGDTSAQRHGEQQGGALPQAAGGGSTEKAMGELGSEHQPDPEVVLLKMFNESDQKSTPSRPGTV